MCVCVCGGGGVPDRMDSMLGTQASHWQTEESLLLICGDTSVTVPQKRTECSRAENSAV